MHKVFIDFETYGGLDLRLVGSHRYIEHPSFDLLCMAYAVDDEEPELWLPEDKTLPLRVRKIIDQPDTRIYAHNAGGFETLILQKYPRILGKHKLHKFVDTQALAAAAGLPLGLDKAARAAGVALHKDPKGSRLIVKLSRPRKITKNNKDARWTPATAEKDFYEMYDYCLQDVIVTRALVDALPFDDLTANEQRVWRHTIIQNNRGVPVDLPSVQSIRVVLDKQVKKRTAQLNTITHGRVKTIQQRDKILAFIKDQGLVLPDLTAATVKSTLENKALDTKVRAVLEIRRQLAKTSTKKFTRILAMVSKDGRVQGNVQYYGAHTGRFAGRGIQIHNLPRAKVTNPDEALEIFRTEDLDQAMDYSDQMVHSLASKLIRPIICTTPRKELIVSDYSSIENRALHWLAGDIDTLKEFKAGLDQYKTFASARFGVPYKEVTAIQRQYGKVCILGLGYGAGPDTLIDVAAQYGLELNVSEATQARDFYRSKYALVPKLWRGLMKAAVRCVTNGREAAFGPITFRWTHYFNSLLMFLPSGRCIFYPGAVIQSAKMPWTDKDNRVVYQEALHYQEGQILKNVSPGLLTENLVQAVARDILVEGAMNVEAAGYKVIGTVHDEVIAEGKKGSGDLYEFNRLMCEAPDWAKGLPLKAEGYTARRYKKD